MGAIINIYDTDKMANVTDLMTGEFRTADFSTDGFIRDSLNTAVEVITLRHEMTGNIFKLEDNYT